MGFDDGAARVRILALVHQVEIFFQSRAHGGHVLLFAAGGIKTALRIERVNLLAALEDLQNGEVGAVIRLLLLRV